MTEVYVEQPPALPGSAKYENKEELDAAELGANTDANHTCTKFF